MPYLMFVTLDLKSKTYYMLLEKKILFLNVLQIVLIFTIVYTLWTNLMQAVTGFEFGCIMRFIKFRFQR